MLDWLDGRNASSFQSIGWNGSALTFTISAGSGANGLRTLVPALVGSNGITGITVNGAPVTYTTDTIKGVTYAIINAAAGNVSVNYGPDVTPPVISGVAATSSSSSTATVTWTTNEPSTSAVALGTSPSTLTQTTNDATLTTAHSATLTGLAPATRTTIWSRRRTRRAIARRRRRRRAPSRRQASPSRAASLRLRLGPERWSQ